MLTPGTTANQLSVWVTADAAADGAGVHMEPWARRSYFLDAGATPDGHATADGAVTGDATGTRYASATADSAGYACAASPENGAGLAGGDPTVSFVALAGPGAASAGFATRTVVITQGSSLTFTNADTANHNLESADRDELGYPVFSSDYVDLGQSSPVAGVEVLAPGSYGFYCAIHPNMTGSLVVQ